MTPYKYLSENRQREMLVAVGVEPRAIYAGPDEWAPFVRSLRPGDEAVVAELAVFGSRKTLGMASDQVAARRAVLVPASTDVRVDHPTLKEAHRTETQWAGRRSMGSQERASELGKRGVDAHRKKRAASRLDQTAAEMIWRDTIRYRTRAEALEHMPGWTVVTAWRKFGPREPQP